MLKFVVMFYLALSLCACQASTVVRVEKVWEDGTTSSVDVVLTQK